jgi:hypothetical protein
MHAIFKNKISFVVIALLVTAELRLFLKFTLHTSNVPTVIAISHLC